MNMRPENRCPGSDDYAPELAPGIRPKTSYCGRCHRHGINVRNDGVFYVHSKVKR